MDRGCARVPVGAWIGVAPVCPCAPGSGCTRAPGQRQVQKPRNDTFAGTCSLFFGSPNSASTVRVSYGRCKGRCLIWVLLILVCSLLPINFHMVRLLWHIEVHFGCAGLEKVFVCVVTSTVFLLNILLLNIKILLLNIIFVLNINIIIFFSLDTNFNRLRSTQRMFQLGMFHW